MNRKFLGLAVVPLLAVPLAACGPASSSGNGRSAPAAQLKADGYSPFNLPGYGKAALGINGHSYEAVWDAGKLAQQVVYLADKKPEKGITFKISGTLVIVDAASLSGLKDAAKTVAAVLH